MPRMAENEADQCEATSRVASPVARCAGLLTAWAIAAMLPMIERWVLALVSAV